MKDNNQPLATNDPFNASYFFAAVAALLAFPLLHVILGWVAFYIK